jgi:hypothetical protein
LTRGGKFAASKAVYAVKDIYHRGRLFSTIQRSQFLQKEKKYAQLMETYQNSRKGKKIIIKPVMAGGLPRPGVAAWAWLIALFQSVLMSGVFVFTAKKYVHKKTFHLKNNLRYLGVSISRVNLRWELK